MEVLESCKQKSIAEIKKSRKFRKTEKGHSKAGWRGITSPAWMKLSVGLVLHGILLRVKRLKTLFHACVIDAQELVLSGDHIGNVARQ